MASIPEIIVRRLIEEGFNRGDLSVVDQLSSPSFREHQNFGPDHAAGTEGLKGVIRSLRGAFSDFHLSIDDLAVSGETVWLRLTGTGTNDGRFMGHAPTGRRIRIDVIDIVRVEAGLLAEHWGVPDRLGALFQLGLAEPPSTTSSPGADVRRVATSTPAQTG